MAITFNSIPATLRVPLFYAEMDNSRANQFSTHLRALVIGMCTEGSADTETLTLVNTDDDATRMFGAGSMIEQMSHSFRRNNAAMELWALPIKDSGIKAGATITCTVDNLQAGVIALYVGTKKIEIPVTSVDTAASIAVTTANIINNDNSLPITATSSAGSVTCTAKNGGTYGNSLRLTYNYRGEIANEKLPDGLTIHFSSVDSSTGYGQLSGGSGSMLLPISALGDEEFDFIVLPQADPTLLDTIAVEMNDTTGRWSYLRQLFGHVYTAQRGSPGLLQTLGSSRNDQHVTIYGYENGVLNPVWQCAAAYAAANSVSIASDPAMPTQTLPMIGILPAKAGQRFIWSERQILLSTGIATAKFEAGQMRIERARTTYNKNAYGLTDISYFDSETMHTSAYFLRRIRSMVTSMYGRCKLADDGTRIGAGQAVVTPQIMRNSVFAEFDAMENLGILENAKAMRENTIIERNQDDPNRLDMLLAPDYVNQLRIVSVKNQFRLQS